MHTHAYYSGTYKHCSIYMCICMHTHYCCTCTQHIPQWCTLYTQIHHHFIHTCFIYTTAVHMYTQMQCTVVDVHDSDICTSQLHNTYIHTGDTNRHTYTVAYVLYLTHTGMYIVACTCMHTYYTHSHRCASGCTHVHRCTHVCADHTQQQQIELT